MSAKFNTRNPAVKRILQARPAARGRCRTDASQSRERLPERNRRPPRAQEIKELQQCESTELIAEALEVGRSRTACERICPPARRSDGRHRAAG